LKTSVPGLRRIRQNLRCLPLVAGSKMQISNLFREILMCIKVTCLFPIKFVDYSTEVMYQKIAEERNIKKIQGKKYMFRQGRIFIVIYSKAVEQISEKEKIENMKNCMDAYRKAAYDIDDPEKLYEIIKLESNVMTDKIKKWKRTAFDPRMGRRTETEWYDEVRGDGKFEYLKPSRKEIDEEVAQLNYKSWRKEENQKMEIILRVDAHKMSTDKEAIIDTATLEITKEILDAIIGSQSEFIAEFKVCCKSLKKDMKLIQVMIRRRLKPKIKYMNKFRRKKGKISHFGLLSKRHIRPKTYKRDLFLKLMSTQE
jgi:hypothetical protein